MNSALFPLLISLQTAQNKVDFTKGAQLRAMCGVRRCLGLSVTSLHPPRGTCVRRFFKSLKVSHASYYEAKNFLLPVDIAFVFCSSSFERFCSSTRNLLHKGESKLPWESNFLGKRFLHHYCIILEEITTASQHSPIFNEIYKAAPPRQGKLLRFLSPWINTQ